MTDRAPYSRVYWSVIEDEKFDGIREDMRHFGTWSLLLIVADMAWPAPAFVPPGLPRGSIRALIDCGLIDPLSGGRFRVHGLEAERERRSDAARGKTKRDPNGTQTGPERDPLGLQDKTKTRQDKDETETPRDPADIYWQLTGKFPSPKTLPWIDDMAAKFGTEAVIRVLATAHIEDAAASTLLGRVQDRLRSESRELDRAEQKAEQDRLAEKRAKPRVLEPWQEEFRRLVQKQYDGAA